MISPPGTVPVHLNSPCVWFHTCQCHIQNRGNLRCIYWAGMSLVWRADVDRCRERSCPLALALFSACTKPLRKHLNLREDRFSSDSEAGAGFPEPVPVTVPVQSLWLVKSAPWPPSASWSQQTLEGAGTAVAESVFLRGNLVLSPMFFSRQMLEFFVHERKSTSAIIKTVTGKA